VKLFGRKQEPFQRVEGEPSSATWKAAADAFPQTGQWPLLLVGDRLDLGRVEPVQDFDVRERLEGWWVENQSEDEELAEMLGPFPGVAEPGLTRDEGAVDVVLSQLDNVTGLVLVAVERPADVLAAIGWTGAINSQTAAELTPFLRSWEERFDTLPVAVGYDTLQLVARRLPSAADAEKITAELYLFNNDLVDLDDNCIAELAPSLMQPHWQFWWD